MICNSKLEFPTTHTHVHWSHSHKWILERLKLSEAKLVESTWVISISELLISRNFYVQSTSSTVLLTVRYSQSCWNYRSLNLVIEVFMFGFVYVKQYLDCHMLEVTMRLWQLRCPTLESVIDSDMCGVESIKLLYFLFIFESYFGLIHGWRSSTRLPLPLSRFPHGIRASPGWAWFMAPSCN